MRPLSAVAVAVTFFLFGLTLDKVVTFSGGNVMTIVFCVAAALVAFDSFVLARRG